MTTRARAAVALVATLALASAAPLAGRLTASAQDAAPPGEAAGGVAGGLGPAPTGTPGGPETPPRPGPPTPPLPAPGTVLTPGVPSGATPGIAPAPSVDPGPEIADPGVDPDLGDALDETLGETVADEVAEPDLGEAGEAVGAASDLDPEDPLLADAATDALDLDPLDLGADVDLGRVDLDRGRPRDRGRRARPDLGRVAERGPGGLTLAFGLDLALRAEDNAGLRFSDEEGEAELVAGLSFGVLSQTRRQRLAADLDADVTLSSNPDDGEDDLEVEGPRLRFAYEREGARSRLGAVLRYARTDLDEVRLIDLDERLDGLPDEDDLVVSGGTRADLDAEVELVLGLDRPLGFELELRADRRSYEDAGDPELTDRDILEAEGALRLDVTPLLTARLTFDVSDLDDDSGETRETRAYGVSALYAATARTTLTAALSASGIEALRNVDLDDDGEDDAQRRSETSGVEGLLGLVHDLPNGTLSAEIESELEERGRRDTLRIARAFEPRQGVDLSASVGLTRGEGEQDAVVADIAYAQELARGRLTASVERRVGTSSDGNALAATSASLGLLQRVNRLSRVTLDLDFALVEDTDGDGDESQSELRLAYVRDLTPDWSLSAGYELNRRAEGDDAATSNALFLTLGRDFVIRP